MPKSANAATVPPSSITIKAMSTFGHFHFLWKWGILMLNIVGTGVLGSTEGELRRGGWSRREVECCRLGGPVVRGRGRRRRDG
jgi:hypothetical protein